MTHLPIHILFVLPSFAGGGAERVTLTLMNKLDTTFFSSALVVLDGQGPLADMLPMHAPMTDLKTPRLRSALFPLMTVIRDTNPDVVFSTLGYVNIALLAARPFLPRRTRFVVREANMPSLSLPHTSHPLIFNAAYRFLYRRADSVICTSMAMREEMESIFCVPASRLTVLPNPVDEGTLRNAATPTQRHGGDDGLRLVAAGRLTKQKGFERLVHMIAAHNQNIKLTILGEGPGRASLVALIHELGLNERVRLMGFCKNPWAYYAGADAFIMTSIWEGLPNAVLEALACGTPVIATPESGGIAEIAAAAPDGAVTVVEAGVSMMKALQKIEPKPPDDVIPRPSLLPLQYRSEAVGAAFSKLLIDLN